MPKNYTIQELPELPKGLEWEYAENQMMCPNCYGIVAAGSVMLRRDQRRKAGHRYFEKYFPAEDGFCLKCAALQFGAMAGDNYDKAEAEIDAIYRLEKVDPNDPLIPSMNEVVDALQDFITGIGDFIGKISKIPVEYIVPPTQDFITEMREDNGAEKS
jgi:hypothetical protein